MKKVCMVFFLEFAFATANFAKTDILENIEKANNFYGYKGNVSIKVMWHDTNYSNIDGMGKNEGRIYKAYFDFVDNNNQKIIFYEDEESPELEISLTDYEKLKIIYDKKDISENLENYKDALAKYPYTFLYFLYDERNAEINTPNLLFSVVVMSWAAGEVEEVNLEASMFTNEENLIDLTMEGDYEESIVFSKDYRMLGLSYRDGGYGYEWGENAPKTMSVTFSMFEGIKIEFLDENGWVKNSGL